MSDSQSKAPPDGPPGWYPGFDEELAARQARARLNTRAHGLALPGQLRLAFPLPRKPADKFRPVTLADIALLEHLDHPFMAHGFGAKSDTDLECNPAQIAQSILMWTLPSRDAWREVPNAAAADLDAVLAGVVPEDHALLALSLYNRFLAAFCTSCSLEPRKIPDQTYTYSNIGGDEDGCGWWFGLFCSLVRDFHFSQDEALHDVPLIQAFAMRTWNGLTTGLELTSDGYVNQAMQWLAESEATPAAPQPETGA